MSVLELVVGNTVAADTGRDGLEAVTERFATEVPVLLEPLANVLHPNVTSPSMHIAISLLQ